MMSAGEGEHEPGEGEGDDEEVEKIAEGEEDALLARGAGEPGKGGGDCRGTEKHCGEMAELHGREAPSTTDQLCMCSRRKAQERMRRERRGTLHKLPQQILSCGQDGEGERMRG